MIELKNNQLTIIVSEKGAELQSIKNANGKEYLWQGDPKYWGRRSPILFPIVCSVNNETYRVDGKEYHLPRHGFDSVDDGSDALGDLDALEPLCRDVIEPPGSGETAHDGTVFVEHLDIDAALPQETDLPRSGDGVAVSDRYRGGILETVGKGAACHLLEAFTGNDFRTQLPAARQGPAGGSAENGCGKSVAAFHRFSSAGLGEGGNGKQQDC